MSAIERKPNLTLNSQVLTLEDFYNFPFHSNFSLEQKKFSMPPTNRGSKEFLLIKEFEKESENRNREWLNGESERGVTALSPLTP